MMQNYSTVIISNRLPVSVSKVDGKLVYETSSGGLATAMSSLRDEGRVWVGWPGIDADSLSDEEKIEVSAELSKQGYYPVFLTAHEMELYYEGYANNTLWPLFHYFQNVTRYADDYWDVYQSVNKKFTEAATDVASPNARIWIQDYHLMLLPALIREETPDATIGFFLHIPFPVFEIFRLLPQRKELLSGLLGADVIGFHMYDYAQYFLDSCRRLLGIQSSLGIIEHEQRTIKVSTYPIGIDYTKFREQLKAKETKGTLSELRKSYGKQQLILSVDRLDYSKGILERLDAFSLLLENHPEHLGNITLLMIAVPSRTEVHAYQQLRNEIERKVSRINGTYGTVSWAPISYQFQNRPFSEIVALYARADVMLVTPVRDGMNLVAKEYVASKNRSGVLILSEMAGAIDELPEALSINPSDGRSIQDAIHTALTMPQDEQHRRLSAMKKRLRVATIQNWGKEFMDDLENSTKQEATSRKQISLSQQQQMVTRYQSAKKRLIILDYDGTLRNFVKTPSPIAAAPTLRIRRIVKALSDQPNTKVAIVSGRTRRALSSWFVGVPLILAAEHGAWKKYGKKWQEVHSGFKKDKKRIRAIMEEYTSRTQGSKIEEKDHALVWHYVNVEPDIAFKRASELKHDLTELLASDDITVHEGRKIIEVKPSNISKGNVVKELLRDYPADFVLCAGDDYTDEDMFIELRDNPSATTVKVGASDTSARHAVAGPAQLLTLLESFTPELLHLPLPKIRKTQVHSNSSLPWWKRL